MNSELKIVVTSLSFSKNATLMAELKASFSNVTANAVGRNLTESELITTLRDADVAIVGTEPISDAVLAPLPRLQLISKYGVGLDNVDIEACRRRGIAIGWTGGVNKTAVAEMAVAFMISLCRNVASTSSQLKSGVWNKNGGVQFAGKTVGIIGVGHIGKELIRLLEPFHCRILVNDIVDITDYARSVSASVMSKDALFSAADIITIHTPLTDLTRNLITTTTLQKMKPTAFLINTARGEIVHLADLHAALTNGTIAGAALDTYEIEPPVQFDLLQHPALICTPHIGANSVEAVLAMGRSAIAHVVNFARLDRLA